MTAETANSSDRPSSARRKHLREADANSGSIPTVSNFFPLIRYYEAADKVLLSFQAAFEAKRLDEAFVYGIRYCTFCVEGITKHDYFMSAKFAARRTQTTKQVDDVLTKLELVSELMDVEETEKAEKRRAYLLKQREARLKRQREIEQKRLAELEKRIAQQKLANSISVSSENNVEESALAKLQRLNQPLAPPVAPPPEPDAANKKVSFQLDDRRKEPDGRSFSTSDIGVLADASVLPPPMLPPSPGDMGSLERTSSTFSSTSSLGVSDDEGPPTYEALLENSQISKHSYFGPGAQPTQPGLPSYDDLVSKLEPPPPKPRKSRLSIRQYIASANKRHGEFLSKREIEISPLRTYQGRIPGSTNGCTVISACVVSKHLENRAGVTNDQVVSVIDNDCVSLLRTIRNKLGLGSGSLIIPSDVHDQMVDRKLLFQHKFVGVAGGNIADPDHLGGLFTMLQGEKGKTQALKAGATLFFREHVISIVKFPTSPTTAVYDMVDSLPTCNGRASRTRCKSLEALKVQLEWYSCHKFSDGNIAYIERNQWDDAMADFDPRVFQAFVWADLPLPKQ